MIQIATTPEQSARLIACGVDPKSADMVNIDGDKPNVRYSYTDMTAPNNEPAWSLSALLALLPKEICNNCDDPYYFSLAKEMASSDDYRAAYKPCWFEGEDLIYKRSLSPIEACVQMIEWLVDSEYKLNEINQ